MIAALLGSLVGSITGMIPGLHTNLVAAILLSTMLPRTFLVPFLLDAAIAHTITDAIPSTYLGAASSETALAVMPAHKMLLQGRGYEAVVIAVRASVLAILCTILLTPLLAWILPTSYAAIKPLTWYVLVGLTGVWLATTGKGVLIFLLSGLLGLIVLDSTAQPLFALLTGLFGTSTLLLTTETSGPDQTTALFDRPQYRFVLLGVLGGLVMNLLPAMSTSHTAALFPFQAGHLTLVSSINAADQALTPVMLAVLEKARSGSAEAILSLVRIGVPHLLWLGGVMLVAAGVAALFTLVTARFAQQVLPKIPYKRMNTLIIVGLGVTAFLLSGHRGLLVLATATALGAFSQILRCPRATAMGCLILPTLVRLAPIQS